MSKLMSIPREIVQMEIFQYLSVFELTKLDNSFLNHELRILLLDMFKDMFIYNKFNEDCSKYLSWIIKRNIFVNNIKINCSIVNITFFLNSNHYKNLSKAQNVILYNYNNYSRCSSICSYYNRFHNCVGQCSISNNVLSDEYNHKSIVSLEIWRVKNITNTIFNNITENCNTLLYLKIYDGKILTDECMLNIIKNNNKLKCIHLHFFPLLTDESVIQLLNNSKLTLTSFLLQSCPLISNNIFDCLGIGFNMLREIKIIKLTNINTLTLITLLNNNTFIESLTIIDCSSIQEENFNSILIHCTLLKYYYFKYKNVIIQKDL